MAIVVEATTTSAFATGSTSFSQNRPTGTTNGDLLIAFVFTGNDNGTTDLTVSSAPAGWTLEEHTMTTIAGGSNNPVNVYTYSKIASSEPSSWTWTLSSSGASLYYAGAIMRISGTEFVSAVKDESTVDNDDTPSFSSGVTPLGSNNLLFMATIATDISSGSQATSGYAITTDDPTWTELLDTQNDTTGNTLLASVAYASRSQSTATGNWTVTFSTGSGFADSASQLFCITEPVNANGNHTHLEMSSDIFAHTISVGTTANHSLLEMSSSIFTNSGKAQSKVIWTDEDKPTQPTWTDETRPNV